MNLRLREILRIPVLYRIFGYAIGGERGRERFARTHIRAKKDDHVLDIGCGPADILPHLPDVDYVGFDENAGCIETATKNYGTRGRFYCQRVDAEVVGDHRDRDIVLAVGVLHHLDDAEAEHLFRLAASSLKPGGRLITLDGCYVKGQPRLARHIISRDRGRYVRDERGYVALAERVFTKVRPTIHHDLLRIPYTHLVLECEREP